MWHAFPTCPPEEDGQMRVARISHLSATLIFRRMSTMLAFLIARLSTATVMFLWEVQPCVMPVLQMHQRSCCIQSYTDAFHDGAHIKFRFTWHENIPRIVTGYRQANDLHQRAKVTIVVSTFMQERRCRHCGCSNIFNTPRPS
jgi:hypothetical protein